MLVKPLLVLRQRSETSCAVILGEGGRRYLVEDLVITVMLTPGCQCLLTGILSSVIVRYSYCVAM